jgi:hypothetical protein
MAAALANPDGSHRIITRLLLWLYPTSGHTIAQPGYVPRRGLESRQRSPGNELYSHERLSLHRLAPIAGRAGYFHLSRKRMIEIL